MLSGLSVEAGALLLSGSVVGLTAVFHLIALCCPLPAVVSRDIFRKKRAGIACWLAGAWPVSLTLLAGACAVVLTSLAGMAASLAGVQGALMAGPVPGLLLFAWSLLACQRRLRRTWVTQVVLAAGTSALVVVSEVLVCAALWGGV